MSRIRIILNYTVQVKIFGKSEEIKQKWTAPENLDIRLGTKLCFHPS